MKLISTVTALFLIFNLSIFSQKIHFDNKSFVKGEMLIQFKANQGPRSLIEKAPANYEVEFVKELSKPMRISLLSFDHKEVSHQAFQAWLYSQPEISIADYNYHVQMRSTLPSDPSFTSQWHHVNNGSNGGIADADIDSDLAWDITTGGTTATNDDIVVCLVEGGGGNLDHQDLSPNRWVNINEIPNDNIDNDGNGYTDDFNGWNTGSNNDDYGNSGHGTNCLGMIGAKGNNNIAVTGANWDVKLMVLNMGGNLTQANVVSAYTYPLVMRQLWNNSNGTEGAFVVATSASWGIDGANPASYPLWCQFYDTLGVYGILNVGATTNSNLDVDVAGDMPTACNSDYMIGVGRTDNSDQTAGGYGDQTIELGAPGINVVTTNGTSNGASGTTSTTGTSFSCPLTAGVIGLAYSIPCPNFMAIVNSSPQGAADLVLQALLTGTDPKSQLASKFVTGGRLNAKNTLDILMANVCSGTLCLSPSNIATNNIASSSADIQFTAYNSASSSTLYWRAVGSTNWTAVSNATSPVSISSLTGCSDYEYYMESVCGTDTSSQTGIQSFSTLGCGNCIDLSYCSSGAANSEEWIETLSVGTYSFTTGDDAGYGNFTGNTNYTMDLVIDSTYNITIDPAWQATLYDEQSQIWIDLNQNGSFDANELLYDQGTPSQTTATGSISIPSTAIPGSTRLRVSMAYIGGNITLPGSCDQFTYGEVEDYCVNIIQGTICGMNVTSTVSDPQCDGIDNGSISVVVSGGTPAYTYDWGGSLGTNSSVSGLSDGNYTLVITDGAQCDTTINYALSNQTTITVNTSYTDITCNGANDGTIDVTPSGSSGYSYDWGGSFGNVANLNGLTAGNYTVEVSDLNGCMESATVTISEPAPEQASFTFNTLDFDVDFTNTSSAGNYDWDFGDGNSSTINSPTHTYASNGTYNVCLTLTTACTNIAYCEDIVIDGQSNVGIQNNELEQVSIYPNPAADKVYFEINNNKAAKICIFNASGKLVLNQAVNSSLETIDLTTFSSGIYSCQISTSNNEIIQISKLNISK